MSSVADRLSQRSNNFDLIRLAAALLVLWSHSYVISGHPAREIFFAIFSGYDSGGGIAVSTFFVISGFLVTKSAFERSTADYIFARALRILPALALVVAFTIIVIGPLLTRMTSFEYASDATTWAYLGSASIFKLRFHLADTTANLPAPEINGSLWTLPVECGFYIVVLIGVKSGVLSRVTAPLSVALIIAAYFYFTRIEGLSWSRQGADIWSGASVYAVVTNGSFFLVGSLFWIWRDRLPLTAAWALLCLVIWFVAARTAAAPLVYFTCLPYLVMYLGLGAPKIFRISETIGDLSYGVYLFAFPIQQTIVSRIGVGMDPTMLSLLATPAVLALAFVSWHGVEKRALRLKTRARA